MSMSEKKPEKRLETVFRRLFETAKDGILILDESTGGITEINPFLTDFLGYSKAEMMGKKLWEIGLFDDQAKSEIAFKELQRSGYIRYENLPLRTKGGLKREVEFISNVYKVNSEKVIQCNIRDITERKSVEKALAETNESLKKTIKELADRSDEMTLLSEMGDSLHTCVSLEEAYRVVARFSLQLFPETEGVLYTMKLSKNRVEAAIEWGGPLSGEPEFAPNDCVCLRRGRVHAINGRETSSTLTCQHLDQPAINYLCAPMIAYGEIQGILHLRNKEGKLGSTEKSRHPFTFEKPKLGLAGTIADYIGLALANLKLRDALRQQSILDPVTGLYNRRYMKEALERELRRAIREQRHLGILMFDIDRFKNLNDSFGHEAGDAVLNAVGGLLKSQTRGNDIPCRYGGEEFLIILPKIPLDECEKRAETLRKAIKDLEVRHEGRTLPRITFSIGVSEYPEHGDNLETLLKVADNALYKAKARGRDQVSMGQVINPLLEKEHSSLLN